MCVSVSTTARTLSLPSKHTASFYILPVVVSCDMRIKYKRAQQYKYAVRAAFRIVLCRDPAGFSYPKGYLVAIVPCACLSSPLCLERVPAKSSILHHAQNINTEVFHYVSLLHLGTSTSLYRESMNSSIKLKKSQRAVAIQQ